MQLLGRSNDEAADFTSRMQCQYLKEYCYAVSEGCGSFGFEMNSQWCVGIAAYPDWLKYEMEYAGQMTSVMIDNLQFRPHCEVFSDRKGAYVYPECGR